VFNGDVLTDVDLPAVVAGHRASGAAATLVLTPVLIAILDVHGAALATVVSYGALCGAAWIGARRVQSETTESA